ncbi:TetR/AcrR family transcriptional regulator [Nonomuraea longicatena]|uniref:TetR/AcrR family transcriptional regulator n=1 Tax=Nonomuraea longicatena TaxID=83682 RepID=A0ABN1RBS3_9ACTN
MTARKRGRPGYDLESLLAVAVSVFNERGYEATSMEAVAKRLGITKSAIYHHIDAKEDLLQLAVDRALDGLFEAAEQAVAEQGRAIDQLESLVRRSVHILVERLPFVTLLLRIRGNTEVEVKALDRRREFDRMVAGLMRRAAEEGDLAPGVDPELGAKLLFGLVNSLIEWYRPARELDAEALADAVCRTAFDGLRV